MLEVGLISTDERCEPIGGEIVPRSPKGIRHERFKVWLNRQLAERMPARLAYAQETTFRLSADSFVEPDFVVFDAETGLEGLRGDTARLVIEVADESLGSDAGRKSVLYAAHGVPEVRVVDVARLHARIQRDPTPTGYRTVRDVPSEATPIPALVPELVPNLAAYG